MKKNEIIFYPVSDIASKYTSPPQTAIKSNIPDWYREIPKYKNGDKKFWYNHYGDGPNLSVKACLPVIDAFTFGYTIELFCDIQIIRDGDEIHINWSFDAVDKVGPVTKRVPNDTGIGWKNIYGYDDPMFGWMPKWSIKTPKGYSCLFTHPINRPDLPFYTLSGVLDTDKWGEAGNQPFLLKSGWEGIIPAGTPILQIIPFKREKWFSSVRNDMIEYAKVMGADKSRYLKDFYKKFMWSPKEFR